MTGIERLRRLAWDYKNLSTKHACFGINTRRESDLLYDIADQIEREQDKVAQMDWEAVREVAANMAGRTFMSATIDGLLCDWSRKLTSAADGHDHTNDVSMSAYNLLPQEDRDAIAWVREHGGLSHVKEHWSGRVAQSHVHNMAERHKAKIARMQSHIEFVQGKCRERQGRIVELNKTIAAMRPRLAPEGGWPRFEDGEMVLIGSDFADWLGETHTVTSIEFFEDGVSLRWNPDEPEEFEWLSSDERVRRPAPKVLDADGAEIRVGDTVYSTRDTESGTVVYAYPPGDDGQPSVKVGAFWHHASELTHRAPVIAADGRPLRDGEHVWHVETGTELVVKELPKPGAYQAVVVFAPPASHLTSFDPDQLTHERPVVDTWERVEESAYATPQSYCSSRGIDKSMFTECGREYRYPKQAHIIKSVDIVRRCKALAERERGE